MVESVPHVAIKGRQLIHEKKHGKDKYQRAKEA